MRAHPTQLSFAPKAAREAGFTLVELLIAMVVMAEVMAVAYILFDVNTRIGRTQIQVADLQQNQRIAQHEVVRIARMAGRGGLTQNLAVVVTNDVGASTTIVSDADSPVVVEGTDILSVRGIFTAPIFQLQENPGAGNLSVTMSGTTPSTGRIAISETTKDEITQSLDVFRDLQASMRPEPLIIISSIDDSVFSIVEITNVNVAGTTATIDFKINGNKYQSLKDWPVALTSASFAGILEEYRFYVREDFAVPNEPTSEPAPKLSRARVFPGTADPPEVWKASPGDNVATTAAVDIADNMLDLQVALGYDLNASDLIDENPADTSSDEWRFNNSGDAANDSVWQPFELFYVRINTLARTDRPDKGYQADPIGDIEDHSYGEPAVPSNTAEREEREFRRRQLETVVDLRNLG